MIPEEMLRSAAIQSRTLFVESLERDYDPAHAHTFSPAFERKIKKLTRRADHPYLYRSLQRVASIFLAILIGASVWLGVDVEARAAFIGWVKETYETFFTYRYSGEADVSVEDGNYYPAWIPEGYYKFRELDAGGRISISYKNESGQLLNYDYVYDPTSTTLNVDMSGGTLTITTVGKYKADLILFDDPNISNEILWSDENGCAFAISAFLDEDGLVKIASSIYER